MRHPSTPEPPPDRRLVTLPPVVTLSAQQQRGVHCVFCGTALHTGAVRDLGPQLTEAHGSEVRWFPRSCPSCPKEQEPPMMLCDRCGRQIAGSDEERVTIHGASGPGGTITVHTAYCPPPRSRPPAPATPQNPAMDFSSTPPTAP